MATTSYVARNGDLIRWEIPVTNNGSQPDTNVVVTGAFPVGVTFTTATVPSGTTFDSATPQWSVGNLAVGQTKTLVVFTTVNDITLAPFVWTLTVSGDNVDPEAGNDELVLTVEATTCPPSAGAVDDISCGGCGDVSTNDTPCSQCTTEYRENAASYTNWVMTDFDQATGKFHGSLVDPTTDGSFEYTIWCTDCPDGSDYETSGPATVTIPALFTTPNTDSFVDNGDGTFTHTAVDGTAVNIQAGWTTITKEVDDSFTFDYPDGTSTNYNFLNVENVTTLVDNGDGTYSYTSEDATVTTFNVPEFSFRDKEAFTGLTAATGTDIVCTLTLPVNNDFIDVYRNGLLQIYNVDFTRAGNTFTFSPAFGLSTAGAGTETVVFHVFR